MFNLCSTNINKYQQIISLDSYGAWQRTRPSPSFYPSQPVQSWRLRRFDFDFDGDRHFGWQMHPTPNGAGVLITSGEKIIQKSSDDVRWNSKWLFQMVVPNECPRVTSKHIKTVGSKISRISQSINSLNCECSTTPLSPSSRCSRTS